LIRSIKASLALKAERWQHDNDIFLEKAIDNSKIVSDLFREALFCQSLCEPA
jgi:hypothetical protein